MKNARPTEVKPSALDSAKFTGIKTPRQSRVVNALLAGPKSREQEDRIAGAMNCPRFESCSAPICPLDSDKKQRVYLQGEPVCVFMLEHMKPGGKAKIKATIGGKATEAVGKAVQWIESGHSPLRKRLNRASRTASRLGADDCNLEACQ